ncbi:MAG: hypothetical protein ABIS28_04640 [Caldimonas sp.]
MEDSTVCLDTALLIRKEQALTDEGAPPPGVVGTDLPAARPQGDAGPEPLGAAQAMRGVARIESLESLERSIRTAEQERDALSTLGQEDLYIRSCLRVDALEQELESRLMDHKGLS